MGKKAARKGERPDIATIKKELRDIPRSYSVGGGGQSEEKN